MDKMKKIAALLVLSLLNLAVMAQDNATIKANEDVMRSNGKLYVVVAVIVTIVSGIFLYLLNLDRKISRLEKQTGAR
jgi:CcmD family protein